jgi:hypothetical protein
VEEGSAAGWVGEEVGNGCTAGSGLLGETGLCCWLGMREGGQWMHCCLGGREKWTARWKWALVLAG